MRVDRRAFAWAEGGGDVYALLLGRCLTNLVVRLLLCYYNEFASAQTNK